MKTTQRGFVVPLLLIIIAVLVVGGGAYFYTQTKSENPSVAGNVASPQATSTTQTSNQTAPVAQTSKIGRICGGGVMANGGACPAGYLCAIITKGPPAQGTCQVATASPTISSIEVVEGLPTGSVYAGQTAEIFGTDLRGVVSVKIGEQNVPVTTGLIADRALDTDQAFKVPSLPAGVYNVSVTNSSMQTSNVYPVTVVVYSPKSTASQTAGWKTINSTQGSFAFKVPQEFDQSIASDWQNYGIDTSLSIGNKYYQTIGVTGTTTTSWQMTTGFAKDGCSIAGYGPKGSFTSTDIVSVGNLSFYRVDDSQGCGAGRCGSAVRYVEPLTSSTCRFIEFNHSWSNGLGAYDWSTEQKQQVADNNSKIDNNIQSLIPEIIKTIQVTQ